MRTTYSAIITLLLLMIASTAHAESIHIYPSEHIRSLIIIGKYGYVDVVIYASKDINTCNKIITISKNNESILSSYNASSWLHRVIKKILENNLTNSIKLHLKRGNICYAVFEYNMFSYIDRALMTGMVTNNSACLRDISLLDLIESMPATQLLRRLGTIGIYINYSTPSSWNYIREIAGKILYLPGNASQLGHVDACCLPSSLGLPRVVVMGTLPVYIKDLGEGFTLRVLVVNTSTIDSGSSDELTIPLAITINAPHMKPLRAYSLPNLNGIGKIKLKYINDIGIVNVVINRSSRGRYEVFIDFKTLKSGNYTINVTEKLFTDKGIIVIKQFADLGSQNKCGLVEVKAPPTHSKTSPNNTMILSSIIVIPVLTTFIVLYMISRKQHRYR